MILSRKDGSIRVVRQVDHQEQCALMADAWGNKVFHRPEWFEALRTAAAIHDEGWREWEEAPGVSAQGDRVDFPHIDKGAHTQLYRRAIDRACDIDPHVGLIVSLHGRGLYEKRLGLDGSPPPLDERPDLERRFVAHEISRQEELAGALGLESPLAPWPWAAYRLLQAWDSLSLYLTWRGLPDGADGALLRVPRSIADADGVALGLTPCGELTCTVEPWPFRSETVALPVSYRLIENRKYRNSDDLTAALAAAPRRTCDFTVYAP